MASDEKGTLQWTQGDEKRNPLPGLEPLSKKLVQNPPPVFTGESSGRAKLIGIFVAGLLIGILIGFGWASRNTVEKAPSKSSTSTNTVDSIDVRPEAASGSLVVAESQSAGLSVLISAVVVSAPTWVVVYENRNGMPGNALGAALFTSAEQSGSVNLLRTTLSGATYFVGMRRDDGDRTFSLEEDAAVFSADGEELLVQFKTQ